jgi:hypothetical protein
MKTQERASPAIAKALLHRRALEQASIAGVSAQAQALLSWLIAESWVKGRTWEARIGLDLLADKLNSSKSSVQRWTRELEFSQLIRRQQGDGARVTRWTVGGVTGDTPGVSPVPPGDVTSDHIGVSPATPVTEFRINSGDAPPLPARGGQVVPDQKDLNPDALPLFESLARRGSHAGRSGLERLAAQGNDHARTVLDELPAPA